MEVWKDIKNFEEYYQISNLGRIKSLLFYNHINNMFYKRNRLLKNRTSSCGYTVVTLTKNKKNYQKQLHRLIAEAFIPNIENKEQVNHINGIKTDNRIENLEWCTPKENVQHAFRIGLNKGKFGNKNGKSKNVNQYDLKGNFIKTWESLNQVQTKLGIFTTNISRCCKGEYKQSNGYIWKY